MNMVIIENLIAQIENKKPVELVQELEKYEIKKSPLSSAARGKVINKGGSDYVSENKDDYGPCIINGQLNYDNCHCSSDELDRQLKIIRNERELEALEREKREQREKELEEEMKKAAREQEERKKRFEEERRLRQQRDRESFIKKGWNNTFGW